MEENVGQVHLDVVRTRGSRERVHVTLRTESLPPRAALGLLGPDVVVSLQQAVKNTVAMSWHSVAVGNETYAVMVNRQRLGNLQSPIGSSGAIRAVADSHGMDTMLYRWQGVFLPVQVWSHLQYTPFRQQIRNYNGRPLSRRQWGGIVKLSQIYNNLLQ